MQGLVLLSASLVLSCFASPVVQKVEEAPALKQNAASELATFAYAVDLSAPVSISQFQCIRNNMYYTAFIRAYTPAGSGQIDTNACTNIQNALAAAMGTEVYMTPQPNSVKSGAQQFDEMYNNLKNSNIAVRSVWIQVASPTNWYVTSSTNINFLNTILARATQFGVTVGIYTNSSEWKQITGGARINNAMLWYWNTKGNGVVNESPANFNDFHSFGSWSKPLVKQFAQVENICGIAVNRDIYSVSSAAVADMSKSEKSDEITVGGLGLEGAANLGKPEIGQ
ncbi:LYSozyme [Trichostrongylus colubriformis]|uniref:LYSozyme n=1 Tax=Trichostrongylus colubriformis TaxID=6319 RepID=A0AAN8FNA9_TRICO